MDRDLSVYKPVTVPKGHENEENQRLKKAPYTKPKTQATL